MTATFETLGTPEFLLRSLQKRGITAPTPIQVMSIPVALTGKDLFASAATGSGKTIAYLIPIIANLVKEPDTKALILAPTRELAQQISDEIFKFSSHEMPLKTALLIGGRPYYGQILDLKKNSRIIIGTPGRVRDHLERGSLKLDRTTYFILDETDRMLDLGFSDDLTAIAKRLPKEKQTLMFSATMSASIEKLSKNWLTDPVNLAADGPGMQAAANIKEESVFISRDKKFSTLLQALTDREGAVIVFVRTKIGAEDLARKLRDEEHLAEAIHGDLPQRKRDRVIKSFRAKKSRIMVATDVASRGLDIPHIMHVINYDLPECAEDYVHRVGRTGRAGKEGFALSFISPEEKKYWRAIKRLSGEDDGLGDEPPARRRSSGGGYGNSYGNNRPARRPFSPRSSGPGAGGGRRDGEQREWKPNAGAGSGRRDGEQREWKPNAGAGGGRRDGEQREWKPNAGTAGTGRRDGEQREWSPKPRFGAGGGAKPRGQEFSSFPKRRFVARKVED